MPHGITQCYLPPSRGDIPALTPAKAGTRLSDPGGMQGWVDLVACYIPRWYSCSKVVTHPGSNQARRALTSFIRRTLLTTMPRRQPRRNYGKFCGFVNCCQLSAAKLTILRTYRMFVSFQITSGVLLTYLWLTCLHTILLWQKTGTFVIVQRRCKNIGGK